MVWNHPVVYAIGDIHGCHDLLRGLIEEIRADAAGFPKRMTRHIVGLGDYVDRGAHSAEVIAELRNGIDGFELTCLKGNHEDMMVRSILGRDQMVAEQWLANGGVATLRSYDVSEDDLLEGGPLPDILIEDTHWIAQLPVMRRFKTAKGYLICVHAGIKPGIALQNQNPADLMWIRKEFLDFEHPFGNARIVHGHTPNGPDIKTNRVNLDAGAFMKGRLYAGVFDCRKAATADPRLIDSAG